MALRNQALVSWILKVLSAQVPRKKINKQKKQQQNQATQALLPAHLRSFSASRNHVSAPWGWDASGRQGARATLQEHGGKGALPQAVALESPIVSGHQLAHALSDVDRLDLFGLEAEITSPDGRGLGGQQAVGTLGHAGALAVEPLLAGGLTQDGILVIVHLAPTGTTRVYQAWGRLGP